MKTGLLYKVAKTSFLYLRDQLIFNYLLYPYGKYRFNQISRSKKKSQNHTYTSFYRSPLQLKVLTSYIQKCSLDNFEIAVFAGSNGAEAYTIASHLTMSLPKLNFKIYSSDLHVENINIAKKGIYQKSNLRFLGDIPNEFISNTFVQEGESYLIKPKIKDRVHFSVEDLLAPDFLEKHKNGYEIIFLQNVLFHLEDCDAQDTFERVIKLVKPGGLIFIDGMNLDMREKLTQQHRLIPIFDQMENIYSYSRKHIPRDWWNYYYGCEPINIFNRKKIFRYCTIFSKPLE
jgi:chemotaxis methyl-accepting protein methylase